MKFNIQRASSRKGQPFVPPVKSAVLSPITYAGTDGQAVGRDEWVVEITSIDGLMMLIKEAGKAFIIEPDNTILIYDEYVE